MNIPRSVRKLGLAYEKKVTKLLRKTHPRLLLFEQFRFENCIFDLILLFDGRTYIFEIKTTLFKKNASQITKYLNHVKQDNVYGLFLFVKRVQGLEVDLFHIEEFSSLSTVLERGDKYVIFILD